MDLCLKHNTDCFINLVGSRTQFSVSYSSALLVPSWQLMSFCVHAGPVAWIMLFFVRWLTFLRVGWIASLFGCLNVGVYLSGS